MINPVGYLTNPEREIVPVDSEGREWLEHLNWMEFVITELCSDTIWRNANVGATMFYEAAIHHGYSLRQIRNAMPRKTFPPPTSLSIGFPDDIWCLAVLKG